MAGRCYCWLLLAHSLTGWSVGPRGPLTSLVLHPQLGDSNENPPRASAGPRDALSGFFVDSTR